MENSYEQLIDDYNNGILVEAGESLTDYINRMGGVKKANGGIITALRIGLANGSLSPDELAALEEEVKQNIQEAIDKLLYNSIIEDYEVIYER